MELRVGTSVLGPGGQRFRVARIAKFDPSQPRANDGKWTSGGGSNLSSLGKVEETSDQYGNFGITLYHEDGTGSEIQLRPYGDSPFLPKNSVYVSHVWVSPSQRGKGVAAHLYRRSVELAKGPVISNSNLSAQGSKMQQAFLKRGWAVRTNAGVQYKMGLDVELAKGWDPGVDWEEDPELDPVGWIEGENVEKAFNPSQPRDERGRWSSGGGLGAGIPAFLARVGAAYGGRQSVDSYMLEHGRGFATDADSYMGGTPHECFKNSTLAVMARDDFTYVEGYVDVHGVPIHHAWAVNTDGIVRDPTIRDGKGIRGYFGVPIKRDYMMRAVLEAKVYGVLTHNQTRRLAATDPADVVAGLSVTKAFDPSQPRAQDGKWTSGGGAGSGSPWLVSREGDLFGPPLTVGKPQDCESNAKREYYAQRLAGKDPDYVVGRFKGVAVDGFDTSEVSARGIAHAWVAVGGKIVDSTPMDAAWKRVEYLPEQVLSPSAINRIEKVRNALQPEVVAGLSVTKAFDPNGDIEEREPKKDPRRFLETGIGLTILDGDVEKAYDPSQPRDEGGKWTSGGGGSRSLTANQKEAISRYTGGAYASINPGLRAQEPLHSVYDRTVTVLDTLMSPAVKDEVLYRGTADRFINDIKSGGVGSTFVDLGFVSTSRDVSVAQQFKRNRDASSFLEIRVPKGAGIYGMEAQGEREVLIARGTIYRYVADGPDGRVILGVVAR